MELAKLRKKIDEIDAKIVELLNKRVHEVIKVSKLKKKRSISIYSPEREAIMLNRLKKINKGPFGSKDLENVFLEILSVCRAQNRIMKVAYLGPQGTFTHLAARRKFGKKPTYLSAESIKDVFDKVQKDEADYGVVPVENSIEGVVNYTLDMFLESSLNICAEVTLSISHTLFGSSLKNIKKIYSNPQVFAQCRRWILRFLPRAELVPTLSTARAAGAIRRDKYGACIGNKVLANLYGLKTIATSIEDSSSNFTRFLVIAKNDSFPSGRDKTSILFSIKDKVGALYDVLSCFKDSEMNLTKIESRPSRRKAWEYYFFVDVQGHKKSASMQKALEKLEKKCIFVKILGSYPQE